jgi:hypothetical protein
MSKPCDWGPKFLVGQWVQRKDGKLRGEVESVFRDRKMYFYVIKSHPKSGAVFMSKWSEDKIESCHEAWDQEAI